MAVPKSGAGPGVLVLHSWWGLTPFFKRLSDRFARAGFVALAPDLYSGETATTESEARALRSRASALRRQPAYKMLIASIEYLSRHAATPRVGLVGFSMGGHWALWLSQRPELPIAATVVFYAARSGHFARARTRFLFHLAEADEWVSPGSLNAMKRSLKRDGHTATYCEYPGTGHWFFEADREGAFNKRAAATAWARTIEFLKSELAGDSCPTQASADRSTRQPANSRAIGRAGRNTRAKGSPSAGALIAREVPIDRAIYLVNDTARTYRFLRRNPDWCELSLEANEANKRSINGYTRQMRSGRTKSYRRAEHP